ncbi:ABC transporter substrate-binding protein [Myxococcus sp. RHSTA-1-4]|uniref:ABC transporter substrate-binding protein n=1 Tax=Myxococcus sp. RHSTA-1-4 TaxID=2874601 RepID=UPI001CC0B329|nr:ABC transporter substrate-binding protein [Myxococcus sp. RHSTA-1-4]MBZ4416569.1 ABC transporter substrate-binding protein [Myxococcus sp. RHSTA-1-4]
MRHALPLLLATLALGVACEKKSAPTPTPTESSAPAGAQATPTDPNALRIGVLGSLTGGEATYGISARNGILLALQEANAEGGVKGKKLDARVYDSQGRPEEAAQAATRLITQDKVALILGDTGSSATLAVAEKAQAAGVPVITPSATNPEVTQKGDNIFRVCFIDPFQGLVMAKFARDNLKLDTVAVLRDNKSAYSIGLADTFVKAFTERGGKVVADESYSKGDTDFRAQITAIKKAKPQGVYVPGYYSDAGIIARQVRELGLTAPLLGGDGWGSDKLFELGGSAVDGSYFSNHYSPDNPEPRTQKFIANYKAAYGTVPDAIAALGYDAARVAVEALKKAPDTSGPALRQALAATKDFPGVTGTLSLDANRNPVKSAVVLKVANGKTEFVTTVAP